ncbi:porin [Rhizobium sp. LjRoot98]|uniref:porin n=1 Tax=unclassified Rhizobium TaxID=2613769 RepID=UPI000713A970|nr:MULTISPECIES: porin [unclassified Rhizobium]KQV42285.1 porin [Rhizobium sp. Root1204]KQY18182.1 porin [Rhizobium sp. Root1334]KRB98485.1 porin [Rhizobium sp. Root73]
MAIRTLLLCSSAALMISTGAQAADAIVAAEPEPMEYVRVCEAFGKGYFYIPGTETCLKIGGYVRFDSNYGESPYSGESNGWDAFTRGTLTFDAKSDTEYGTLESFIELRSDANNINDVDTYLNAAFIQIAGFRAGYGDSRYDIWLNSAGNIINDDVIDYTGDRTNQISYVYGGDIGFSALIGLEEGAGSYDTGFAPEPTGLYHGHDFPHIIGGLRYFQNEGTGIAFIGGYDTNAEAFGGKIRIDVAFNDVFSAWVMGGYQSDWDNDKGPGGTRRLNYYGPWLGDWAVWGGFAANLTDKASLNVQGAYEDDGTFAAALNIDYAVVEGLKFQPEINYTEFDGERGHGSAIGGTIRLQRNF